MSDFIYSFFKKDRTEITLADIEALFQTPQNETPTLELKSGEVDITKLYPEITALHNTDGGLLILGAPRGSNKVFSGELRPSSLSRNALTHGIGSNIVPPPIGISIHPIEANGGWIYLIDVPKSNNPPHQYLGCYYVRFDEESKPAPHGFVEAMFQKRRVPVIVSKTTIENKNQHVVLTIDIRNSSVIPAHKVNYSITITGRIDKTQLLERPVSFTSFAQTVSGELISQSAIDKIDGILVRGMLIERKVIVKVADTSKYLLVAVEAWTRDTELTSTYSVFRIVKEHLEYEVTDIGREQMIATTTDFLHMEANATDR